MTGSGQTPSAGLNYIKYPVSLKSAFVKGVSQCIIW